MLLEVDGNNQNGHINLSYVDGFGNWQAGDTYTLNGVNYQTELLIASGLSMVTLSALSKPNGPHPNHQTIYVYNLQWDAEYSFLPHHFYNFVTRKY